MDTGGLMDNKLKLMAIALGIFCVIAFILAFSYVGKYNTAVRDIAQLGKEKTTLREENIALAKRAANAQEEFERLKERQESMKADLDRLGSERDDLQKRFDALFSERGKLIEKLQKSLAEPQAITAPVPELKAPTPDEYWASVLKEKTNLEVQLSNLKNTLGDIQLKMDEAVKNKESAELEFQRVAKEKEDAQRQLEYNEKMVDSLSLQLAREKDYKRKVQDQIRLLKEENYGLRARLKDTLNRKMSLEKRLKETEDKRMELYNRLNQMDQLLQEKLSAVLDTKQDLMDIKKGSAPSDSSAAVELSPIIVQPRDSGQQGGIMSGADAQENMYAPITGHASGKIVSFNEENSFVVLDMGEKQGMHKGKILHSYRGSRQIATLEIIQVRANVSAADIKNRSGEIKVGDIVR